MQLIIENKKLQKKATIEVDDVLFTEPEDLVVQLGLETFKLVTTKTEADLLREKLSVDFGEENYAAMYEVYKDFGTPECKTDRTTILDLIKSKLKTNDKYKPLLEDKNPELLYNCLVTAFSNYCTVRRKMDEQDAEIKSTTICENVFFDYIARFKAIFTNAKTLKELYDQIGKIHQYAGIDRREIYGYNKIFSCLGPLFEWTNDLEKECQSQKPYKPVQEQAFFQEESFINDHRTVFENVIKNLDSLKEEYTNFEQQTKTIAESIDDVNAFDLYADKIIGHYRAVVTAKMDLENELRKQVANELCDVDGKTSALNAAYKNMLNAFIDIRIKYELDHRPWKSESDRTFIGVHFASVNYWNQEINNAQGQAKVQKIDMMTNALKEHISVMEKLKHGELTTEALLNGSYTTKDMNKKSVSDEEKVR